MTKDVITMSHKEVDRLSVMQELDSKLIKQKAAAEQLDISIRQVKRILRKYRQKGASGLISKRRGAIGNRRLPESTKTQALELIREKYPDFGPTFAHEKLTEKHNLTFSVEILRQWMIAEGLWKAKGRKTKRTFQMRERRSHFGELIQIDGSPHHWFEDRSDSCTLIVFIDDATSDLLYLRFVPTETTQAYMEAVSTYINRYGRPVSFYSDKHGIFRVNAKEAATGTGVTQFGRALKELEIESIHAHTPQAKGRVERANSTLQDRLVKEMRLEQINTIEEGNIYLEKFRLDHNRRFGVEAKSSINAHRGVLHTKQELEIIFTVHETRKLTKNMEIQYNNTIYQIENQKRTRRMENATITVCEGFDGRVILLYQGKRLEYTTHQKAKKRSSTENEKTINFRVDMAIKNQTQNTKKISPPNKLLQEETTSNHSHY